MLKSMVVFIFLINGCIYFKRSFLSGKCIFFYISNDHTNTFETDIWNGFSTSFFKLITTTFVQCFSDMLRSWWFQGIAEKDRQTLKEEAIL